MEAPASVVRPAIIEAMVAAAAATPPGAIAELGVYRGGTAWWLAQVARRQSRALWLFDTFCGIPCADAVDVHQVGDFSDTTLEEVQRLIPDAVFVPGEFPASASRHALPTFAFVHVDADQYRSVRAACEVFGKLMVPGGMMWFDDYGVETTPGATAAVNECFGGRIERAAGRAQVRFS